MPDVRWTRSVSSTDGSSNQGVGKFQLSAGWIVQEIGYGEDCEDAIADAFTEVTELVNEDYEDVVDAVLLWWRDGDGDLVDALVDALAPLADNGVIWLMTPKVGRDGHVPPSDIADAAPTAGLQSTSPVNAGVDWQGTRLVAPKSRR